MWNELLISAQLLLDKDLHHQQSVLGAPAKATSRANLLLFMWVPCWELVLWYVRPFTIATVILLMQWKDENFAVQCFLPVTFLWVGWNRSNPSLTLRSPSQHSRTAGNQDSRINYQGLFSGVWTQSFHPIFRNVLEFLSSRDKEIKIAIAQTTLTHTITPQLCHFFCCWGVRSIAGSFLEHTECFWVHLSLYRSVPELFFSKSRHTAGTGILEQGFAMTFSRPKQSRSCSFTFWSVGSLEQLPDEKFICVSQNKL